jgi:predicted HicB family RNase H-like nuclease
MRMVKKRTESPKRGRPATGNTRSKVSVSVPIELLKVARQRAARSGESLSQFVSRAIQTLTLSA